MAMVDVGPAAYRQTYSPSRLAWSEGWWLLGTAATARYRKGPLLPCNV